MSFYPKTKMHFLQEECLEVFGFGKGMRIYDAADRLLGKISDASPYKATGATQNKTAHKRLFKYLSQEIYPAMAFYMSMLKAGIDKQKAYTIGLAASQRVAFEDRKKMSRLKKLPFAYTLCRLTFKTSLRHRNPEEFYQTEYIRADKREVHFNSYNCPVLNESRRLGCEEFMEALCSIDKIVFSELAPKIKFVNSMTLADGDRCCDFHFINMKKINKHSTNLIGGDQED